MAFILRCHDSIKLEQSILGMQISTEMISGKTQAHLSILNNTSGLADDCLLHTEVIKPLLAMQEAAAKEGLHLRVASGFRSYERQLAIWNAKATGQRCLLNDNGQSIDPDSLCDTEKLYAILRWSALPGCSRHHWGTDLDVWDSAAVPENYSLQLVPEEYQQSGPFYALNCWLDEHAEIYGFVRPYAIDRGGVAPEPWHLSYLPIAKQFEAQLSATFVRKILDNSDLVLAEVAVDSLDDIWDQFICTR